MQEKWYRTAWRRNVVDMHIADWDERFMSRFDPANYVEMLKLAKAQSAVLYAHGHAGTCFYPTQVGHMHRGLKGRDVFGETARLCHENGIAVVCYMSLIYDAWAYETHPDWRIMRCDGKPAAFNMRYGVCCPNSPYREHMAGQVQELCTIYDFEGMRFDMTFWPPGALCYCRHCRKRYMEEVGGEIPATVDWEDARWVAFQRCRERWLIEFAAKATATVRKFKPGASVEHQSSTFTDNWQRGVTLPLAEQCDFLQGDFYGGIMQGSFVKKLLYNLTPNQPFGYETTSNASLTDHTTLKSREMLLAKAFSSLAHGGAFVFIDAIDPVGTLNRRVYELAGAVFDEIVPYEKHLGGSLVQDVAVYFSTASKFDFAEKGAHVGDFGPNFPGGRQPHLDCAMGAATALSRSHIPFGVITKRNLKDLGMFKLLVLPDVIVMDEQEAAYVREFVRAGGALYASKHTSLYGLDGRRQVDFMLADVFGVSRTGETRESLTYIAPTTAGQRHFDGLSQQYPLTVLGSQVTLQARAGAEVLGTLTLPYTDPADTSIFASIHSNPPGKIVGSPAIVRNRFGKGCSVYVAGEMEKNAGHGDIFCGLLKSMIAGSFTFEAEAPKAVEITAFHQADRGRFLINLLNLQEQSPNLPVSDAKVRFRLAGRKATSLTLLPQEQPVAFAANGDAIEFNSPRLEILNMFALYFDGATSAS